MRSYFQRVPIAGNKFQNPILEICSLLIKCKRSNIYKNKQETYVEQLQGENSNDRNDRAIRVAAKWYNEHLKDMSAENQLQVIFITNDRKNKEKAIEEGIPAFTCKSPCIQTVSSCLQMHAKIIIRPRSDVHLTIWYFHGRIQLNVIFLYFFFFSTLLS